jgi:hypothetical protein
MDQIAQSALVAAVVGAVVGGLSGFLVARLQRTWDLDARREEDRKARLRAAAEVVFKFLDNVDQSRNEFGSSSGSWPVSRSIDGLSWADRWAVASILSLFPDAPTWPGFFYPAKYVRDGEVVPFNAAGHEWDEISTFTKRRLVILPAELERLGDPGLRNLTASRPRSVRRDPRTPFQ